MNWTDTEIRAAVKKVRPSGTSSTFDGIRSDLSALLASDPDTIHCVLRSVSRSAAAAAASAEKSLTRIRNALTEFVPVVQTTPDPVALGETKGHLRSLKLEAGTEAAGRRVRLLSESVAAWSRSTGLVSGNSVRKSPEEARSEAASALESFPTEWVKAVGLQERFDTVMPELADFDVGSAFLGSLSDSASETVTGIEAEVSDTSKRRKSVLELLTVQSLVSKYSKNPDPLAAKYDAVVTATGPSTRASVTGGTEPFTVPAGSDDLTITGNGVGSVLLLNTVPTSKPASWSTKPFTTVTVVLTASDDLTFVVQGGESIAVSLSPGPFTRADMAARISTVGVGKIVAVDDGVGVRIDTVLTGSAARLKLFPAGTGNDAAELLGLPIGLETKGSDVTLSDLRKVLNDVGNPVRLRPGSTLVLEPPLDHASSSIQVSGSAAVALGLPTAKSVGTCRSVFLGTTVPNRSVRVGDVLSGTPSRSVTRVRGAVLDVDPGVPNDFAAKTTILSLGASRYPAVVSALKTWREKLTTAPSPKETVDTADRAFATGSDVGRALVLIDASLTLLAELKTALAGYDAAQVPEFDDQVRRLREARCDRAADLLVSGRIREFFAMGADDASWAASVAKAAAAASAHFPRVPPAATNRPVADPDADDVPAEPRIPVVDAEDLDLVTEAY